MVVAWKGSIGSPWLWGGYWLLVEKQTWWELWESKVVEGENAAVSLRHDHSVKWRKWWVMSVLA